MTNGDGPTYEEMLSRRNGAGGPPWLATLVPGVPKRYEGNSTRPEIARNHVHSASKRLGIPIRTSVVPVLDAQPAPRLAQHALRACDEQVYAPGVVGEAVAVREVGWLAPPVDDGDLRPPHAARKRAVQGVGREVVVRHGPPSSIGQRLPPA